MNPRLATLAASPGLLVAVGLAARAWGAGPQVDFIFPAGGQRGQTFPVHAGGDFEKQPLQAWADHAGIRLQAATAPGQFEVRLAPDVPTGPHLLRFFNTNGATPPRLFVVGELPELVLTNLPPATAATSVISALPVTLNGRLTSVAEPLTNRVALAPGTEFRAEIVAYAIDSPVAARLSLKDPQGRVAGESTNVAPRDPALTCLITEAGVHELVVRLDAEYARRHPAFAGGEAAVFRLTLTSAPHVPETVTTTLPGRDDAVLIDSPPLPDRPYRVVVRRAPEAEVTHIQRPVAEWPSLNVPGSVNGFIAPANDEDWFSFSARAGEKHRFRGRSTITESGFVPRLRVLDLGGVMLAQSPAGTEAVLEWVAPLDGQYYLVMTDANGNGGPDFRYELEAASPESVLAVRIEPSEFRLAPGGSLKTSVQVRRPEVDRRLLAILAPELPAEVTLTPLPVLPSQEELEVNLRAEAGALPANRPFQLLVSDPTRQPPQMAIARAPLVGRYAAPGDLLTNETDTLWITVAPK